MRGLRRRKEDDEIEKDIQRHKEDGGRTTGERERETEECRRVFVLSSSALKY